MSLPEPRIIDYRRHRGPETCPECGAPVGHDEWHGSVTLSGSADMAHAAEYGVTEPGLYSTVGYTWRCTADADHDVGAPIAYG